MLSITKVELDLILDFHMFLFFEKVMRCGVSFISKKYSKGNSKYLSSYGPKTPTKYITYLEKNFFYSYAMSKSLPTRGFKWMDPAEFSLDKYNYNSSGGYVLKVGLEYPKELQELHIDYPLIPDKLKIKREMLSDYVLKIADDYNIYIDNNLKLLPNFLDEEKYMLYYKTLFKYKIKK